MKKNTWKMLLIVIVTLWAVVQLRPHWDRDSGRLKLNIKPGLDIAGGTSLVYEIDTTDMESGDVKGLATNMIPILMKRIDPGNVANVVMRPQGDRRIEIQLPLASPDTIKRRQAYEAALSELEKDNINLMKIKRALSDTPDNRESFFAQAAGSSSERKAILDELAKAFDGRSEKQRQRDAAVARMAELQTQIDAAKLQGEFVKSMASMWFKFDEKKQAEEILRHVERICKGDKELTDDPAKLQEATEKGIALVGDYLKAYRSWAEAVNDITMPETGKDVQWEAALSKLGDLNLSVERITDTLDMPLRNPDRAKNLAQMKEQFADRKAKIEAVETAYAKYKAVGGSLDDPEDLKRMLKGAGVLEFRILPTQGDSTGKTNMSEIAGYSEALRTKGPKAASSRDYVWCEIEDPEEFRASGAILGSFGSKTYVLMSNRAGETMLRGSGQKEWKLKRSYPTYDSNGRRAIGFSFDPVASSIFYDVTRNNKGRPLGILLDGLALSAPNIEEAISSSGIIRGEFTDTQVADMVNKLNAGSFPARLSEVPISEKSIGATIGADNRDRGIRAGWIGLIGVAAFMIIYYMLGGIIAVIALGLNFVYILALMAMSRATFTLAGIAGLLLTVGMSVDANVLIFERVREEQERGSTVRLAIANGYTKAFWTIFDSNLTTFLSGLVLYLVASEEIKGFAIVLMLGLASSMFTALFVTRVIFDFLLEKRIVRDRLKMFKAFSQPHINWMGLRPVFFVVSATCIIGGMSVFFLRDDAKNNKYDIEFTGGTSVQIDLKEGTGYDRERVELAIQKVGKAIGSDALAAASVYQVGDSQLQYEITTTATNRTIATVKFNEAGKQTVESVRKALDIAMADIPDRLYGLMVTSTDSQTFTISTGQANEAMLKRTLSAAFKDQAEISDPRVDPIVTEAVRKAFGDDLAVREDLGLTMISAAKIGDKDVELADYLGGVKITCTLKTETTGAEIRRRLGDTRYKPDASDMTWYPHVLLKSDLSPWGDTEAVSQFVYVSSLPDAGYREIGESEWARFIDNEQGKLKLSAMLESTLARITQIDPSIGRESVMRAWVAIVLMLVAILFYIWLRFGSALFGTASIVALIHDVCITLGAFVTCALVANTPLGRALLLQDFKINLQTIAAFLTIIGYSLNDTIVVFDRIRENRSKLRTLTTSMVTDSINQTLSRTLLTGVTTLMVILVMYFFGGSGLRGFTFVMFIGIVIGTYSSIAVASPMLLVGQRKAELKS